MIKLGSSNRRGTENSRGVAHMNTLHQRLYNALNLGTRVYGGKQKRWQCTDIEIQRHVLRSIAAFLDCFSPSTSNNSLLKDSVADIVGALVSILQHQSGAVSGMAANVVVKLVSVIPNSVLQLYALDLVEPLPFLLSLGHPEISTSCAVAMNTVLSRVKEMKERQMGIILEETELVARIVGNILESSSPTMPVEYFLETTSLLSTVLTRWPSFRYHVWNNATLMKVLRDSISKPDTSVRVAILKLYSAVALCGHGVEELLQDGTTLIEMVISCMDTTSPLYARMEGFRLAQRLVTGKQQCLKTITMCSEPLVKAIICGMSGWTLSAGKVPNDQMHLLVEACRLALITRWEGEHHILFWNNRIVEVLLSFLLEDFQGLRLSSTLSLNEQISIIESGMNANLFPNLKPYIWDITGFLTIHCEESFDSRTLKNKIHLDLLVTCACLAFLESIERGHYICQHDVGASGSESASRAFMMMMYSPCKYIASKVQHTISEILKFSGEQYVKSLIRFMDYASSDVSATLATKFQSALSLVGLTCLSGLPQYWKLVVENQGIKTLLSFSSLLLKNHIHIDRSSFATHHLDIIVKRTCCSACTKDWDDKDVLMLYALWALAELVRQSCSEQNFIESVFGKTKNLEDQLYSTLVKIRDGDYGPGPRWYAAYILSYFGYYGFQSKLGKRLMTALISEECRDMQLNLADRNILSVHRFVLAVRCPLLLPPEELPPDEEKSHDHSVLEGEKQPDKLQILRLSNHVDHQALTKLLEYTYSGYVVVEKELMKKLKTLTRYCKLEILLQMLCRNRPKWGSSIPSIDLSHALNPALHSLTDVILEAEETNLMGWTCDSCLSTGPHVHAHKIILSSSCEYLQALFRSGMQESHSQSLKVPISWVATSKLLNWFYTDELPSPPSGCIWNNMNTEGRLYELRPYVEIYWLAEFWILENLRDVSSRLIECCLESSRELSVKIIQQAADFSLWELAERIADYAAPIYHKLRDSGDLEALDEVLVDLIRSASVRYSQETYDHSK